MRPRDKSRQGVGTERSPPLRDDLLVANHRYLPLTCNFHPFLRQPHALRTRAHSLSLSVLFSFSIHEPIPIH
eukprot:IDg19190t1